LKGKEGEEVNTEGTEGDTEGAEKGAYSRQLKVERRGVEESRIVGRWLDVVFLD